MTHFIWPFDPFAHDPLLYAVVFFLFALATSVFLPIPIELGLLNGYVPLWILVIVLGLGKATGSILVFRIGARLEEAIDKWIEKYPKAKKWLDKVEGFVAKYGYFALFTLLAIPFMSDTIPLYLFAILNPSLAEAAKGGKNGKNGDAAGTEARKKRPPHALHLAPFVLVNFLAGVTRAIVFLIIIGHIRI